MPKLTISVSDELHGRIERFRNVLNLSAVFQEAITRKVDVLERMENSQMELTERLAVECEGDAEEARAEGRTDGIDWANQSGDWETYKLFKAFSEGNRDEYTWLCKLLEDYDIEIDKDGNEDQRMFPEQYAEGFLEGAVEAFDEAWEDR